jgi:antitoxin VapB
MSKLRKLTKRTGKSLTDAAGHASRPQKGRVDRKRLAELLAYFDSLPRVNEHLSDEEILGYDESGRPT